MISFICKMHYTHIEDDEWGKQNFIGYDLMRVTHTCSGLRGKQPLGPGVARRPL